MTNAPLPAALLLLLAAPAATSPRAPAPGGGMVMQQLTIHQHIIIRIPRMPSAAPEMAPMPMPPMTWEEHKAPKCVPADDLVAATVNGNESVDLMKRDGERLRAKLDKACRALDFYSGFYLETHKDGMVCAHRDSIRSRSGDNCPIDSFKRLVPAR